MLGSMPREQTRNYIQLQRALLQRFSPEGRESTYQVELWGRACRKGESVVSFGGALRKLAREAYPGLGLHEQVLVDLYVRGLPSKEMKRHVHVSKPRSLEAAIVTATTYEAFENPESFDISKPRKPKAEALETVVSVTEAGANSATSSPEMKVLKDLLEAMSKRLEWIEDRRKPKPTPKAEIECFGCGKLGHYRNECPTASTPRAKAKPSLNE